MIVAEHLRKTFPGKGKDKQRVIAVDDVSFEGPDLKRKTVKIDRTYVNKQLVEIIKDQDLSKYIL